MNFVSNKTFRVLNIALLAGIALSGGLAAEAKARPQHTKPSTIEAPVSITTAFIPSGFGDKEPFAVVSGLFPNGCYCWKGARVRHVGNNLHEVQAVADVAQGVMCIMVIVPYTEEVSLGQLERGDHTVRFLAGNGTYFEKTLFIE